MTFKPVSTQVNFIEMEHEILEFWQRTQAFRKLNELRRDGPHWSFIDGPITANNPMGVHHGWGRTYKDLWQRFWAMQGRKERYQNGFDCQGLWVEVEVEKEKGFKSKRDIEAYGLAPFVRECKARVLRQAAKQTEQSIRLGYWMDWNDPDTLRMLADRLLEDPQQVITLQGPQGPVTDTVEQIVGRLGLPELGGSYFTFSTENNYTIWTFLKIVWEKGWLYRGHDVMPWCPRCETGISQHEIVTDGYQELTHAAPVVRFPLRGREREALLVWTTTPWTLTSNSSNDSRAATCSDGPMTAPSTSYPPCRRLVCPPNTASSPGMRWVRRRAPASYTSPRAVVPRTSSLVRNMTYQHQPHSTRTVPSSRGSAG